jgi:hypothetical protein
MDSSLTAACRPLHRTVQCSLSNRPLCVVSGLIDKKRYYPTLSTAAWSLSYGSRAGSGVIWPWLRFTGPVGCENVWSTTEKKKRKKQNVTTLGFRLFLLPVELKRDNNIIQRSEVTKWIIWSTWSNLSDHVFMIWSWSGITRDVHF